MTDDQLRMLVRDAVQRHLGGRPPVQAPRRDGPDPALAFRAAAGGHASHVRYLTLVNPGEACLIEPSVGCNHCGYCQSHGH
jgi:hypothetical protein